MQLKITVRSAQIFKSPKTNLYAVVRGPSSPPLRTTVDTRTAAPLWSPMEFEVGRGSEETLVARIKCKRCVFSKSVGSVELGVGPLLDYYRRNSRGNMPVDIALPILSSKLGKPRGVLYVAYMFVDPLAPSAPPIADFARPYCAAAAVVPSAPPLEEYCGGATVADVVPSAPYLPDLIRL